MPDHYRIFVQLSSRASALNIGHEALRPLEERFPHVQFEYLASFNELAARIAEPDVVLCWRFSKELYSRATRLKAVFTPAAGHDWVPDDPSGRVPVVHGSFHGKLIAESLLGMMLHFNNRHDLMRTKQRRHEWASGAQMPRRMLGNQNVLFVGYGQIARHCARVLGAFGCRMTGMQRTHANGIDPETGVRYLTGGTMSAELAAADHVVLLLPGGEATRGFFGAAQFAAMRPSAYLYNFGRGSAVDEDALVAALRSNTIAGAGLDVFAQEPLHPASPLWDLPNVIITPHSSCHFEEYGRLFAQELGPRLAGMFERFGDSMSCAE